MMAVGMGHTATVTTLVEGHADVNIQENVSPAGESCGLFTACLSNSRPQPQACMHVQELSIGCSFYSRSGWLAVHCL